MPTHEELAEKGRAYAEAWKSKKSPKDLAKVANYMRELAEGDPKSYGTADGFLNLDRLYDDARAIHHETRAERLQEMQSDLKAERAAEAKKQADTERKEAAALEQEHRKESPRDSIRRAMSELSEDPLGPDVKALEERPFVPEGDLERKARMSREVAAAEGAARHAREHPAGSNPPPLRDVVRSAMSEAKSHIEAQASA